MSSSFEVAQVVVAIVSAGVSAVSAAIIAWQAIQTRRSTKAATEAVDVARAELAQGERLREDALRAQIDVEMPKITVTAFLHAEVVDPREPSLPVIFGSGVPDRRDRVTQDEYVLPRDAMKELRASGTIKIINDGPRHLQATFTRDAGQNGRPERLDLAPGESKSLTVTRVETVARWAELAQWMSGDHTIEPPYEVRVFALAYRFPGWNGAVENHEVVMGGTVVEPVEGNGAAWRPVHLQDQATRPFPIATLATQPFERRYFRNRPGDETMGWF